MSAGRTNAVGGGGGAIETVTLSITNNRSTTFNLLRTELDGDSISAVDSMVLQSRTSQYEVVKDTPCALYDGIDRMDASFPAGVTVYENNRYKLFSCSRDVTVTVS